MIVRKEGFDYGFDPAACRGCPAQCCRGQSGSIWVNQREINRISSFLRLNVIDFIRLYLLRKGNRLSIKERFTGHDFECVFLEGPPHKCSIYTVRPMQCRQFPFWDHFKKYKGEVIKECPGIIRAERRCAEHHETC